VLKPIQLQLGMSVNSNSTIQIKFSSCNATESELMDPRKREMGACCGISCLGIEMIALLQMTAPNDRMMVSRRHQ